MIDSDKQDRLVYLLRQLEQNEEAKKFIIDPDKHPMDALTNDHPWVKEKYYYFAENPFTNAMPGLGLLVLLSHIDDAFEDIMEDDGTVSQETIASIKNDGYDIFPIRQVKGSWMLSGIRMSPAVYVV